MECVCGDSLRHSLLQKTSKESLSKVVISTTTANQTYYEPSSHCQPSMLTAELLNCRRPSPPLAVANPIPLPYHVLSLNAHETLLHPDCVPFFNRTTIILLPSLVSRPLSN